MQLVVSAESQCKAMKSEPLVCLFSLQMYILISTVSNSSLARSGYLLQTFQISAGARLLLCPQIMSLCPVTVRFNSVIKKVITDLGSKREREREGGRKVALIDRI